MEAGDAQTTELCGIKWVEEAVLSAREYGNFLPVPLRKRWEEPTGGSGAGASVTTLCAATVAQPSGACGVESTPDAEGTSSRLPPPPRFRKFLLFHETPECSTLSWSSSLSIDEFIVMLS
jgi:hypothetical protein